ncbi:hypothetical protein DWW15_17925 [Subdoligranulum sp. AF14-43]|nr:hypothetical protein DWW15_17925 [Subdoligranulum sp. AF14-43]
MVEGEQYLANQKLKLWYDEVEYLTGEQLYEKILVDLQEFAERIIECIVLASSNYPKRFRRNSEENT